MQEILTAYLVSAVIGLLLALAFEPILRRFLIHKFRPWGPKHHLEKKPVPTGGGVIFIFCATMAVIGLATLGRGGGITPGKPEGRALYLLALFPAFFGIIGLIDDFLKTRKEIAGFKARYKIVLQAILAVIFLHLSYSASAKTLVPLRDSVIQLPYGLYIALGTFLFLMMVNGSNFADGLDGLLGGISLIIGSAVIIILSVVAGHIKLGYSIGELKDLAQTYPLQDYLLATAIFLGIVSAILILNFKPAQLYFGDTGSYFIGAFLSAVAILSGLSIYLLILGAVLALEIISVIVQVTYFRLTGGKRILKMSPLHHHLELSGFGEMATVFTFWGLQLILGAISILALYFGLP